jgi:hypothetical protein
MDVKKHSYYYCGDKTDGCGEGEGVCKGKVEEEGGEG